MEETMKNLKKNYLAIAVLLTGLAPWHIEAMNQPAAQQAAPADMKVKTSNGAVVTIPARQVQDFKTLADMQIDAPNDIDVPQLPKISQSVMQNIMDDLQSIETSIQQNHTEDEAIAIKATDLQNTIGDLPLATQIQWTEKRLEAPASLQCDRLLKLYGSIMKVALLSDPSLQLLCDDNAEYCDLIKNLKPHTKTLVWRQIPQIWPELRTLTGHTKNVYSAVFSPDGTQIVTASGDLTAKIWDVATGSLVRTLTRHNNEVHSAAFSADGTQIVTASYDKTAKIWNTETGNCLRTLTGHNDWVRSAAFSPNGTKIVTASNGNTAKIWNAATGNCLHTLTGHNDWVISAAFSPNGTQIVTASGDKTAKIWNVETDECMQTLTGHNGSVYSAAFSPDGKSIVTTSGDNTAKIWQCIPADDFDQALFLQLLIWAKEHNLPAAWTTGWASDEMDTFDPANQTSINELFPKTILQKIWAYLLAASY